MKKQVLFFLYLFFFSQIDLFAQQESILKKDSIYTPSRTSPFNMDERDKYGQKYKAASSSELRHGIKANLGLFGRGVIAVEYERVIKNGWTFQGGIGASIFRDISNELWLLEEGMYSFITPERNGTGIHLGGEIRYHFDEVFEDFFLGFGPRYTSYSLKYDGYSLTKAFTEENIDFLGTMGYGYYSDSGIFYEFLLGAGIRSVNTTNLESYTTQVVYGNNITMREDYRPVPGMFSRPIVVCSVKIGGVF